MIVILKTGVANTASVEFALDRLNCKGVVTADPEMISRASKVILPGVGTANALMSKFQEKELKESVLKLNVPVLGICLGMQALFTHSDEGNVDCLNLIPGTISKLEVSAGIPVPHMGWNKVIYTKSSPLFKNIPDQSYFYFVHSYRAELSEWTVAKTDYGESFSSTVEFKNWFGVQFHPERSGKFGEQLLQNFISL